MFLRYMVLHSFDGSYAFDFPIFPIYNLVTPSMCSQTKVRALAPSGLTKQVILRALQGVYGTIILCFNRLSVHPSVCLCPHPG